MMATANIAEELTCPICLELYKDPRLLPCHHSICKSCLVALYSKKEIDSDIWLHCPNCRHLFEAKDETHIESLPKNFTLASIVCKFRESVKGDKVFPCDVCDGDKQGRAIKKCLQCQVNYCRLCMEQLHPKRGVLARHKLVDAYGEEHKDEEFSSAFLSSVCEIQSVDSPKCDQLKRERYCMTCDEICTKGDESSLDGIHEHHVTTEMRSAVRQKREEVKRILARLLDEDQDLAKGLTDITSLIETIRKKVEEKKIELVQRFGELTEEVERRKLIAETRMEEEMKRCITSLESRLCELEDHKAKTKIKIAAFSELSSLTNDDANLFLIKLKELRNEIGLVTEDFTQGATVGTECDSFLPNEQLMNEIISSAMWDICPLERRIPVHDPNPVVTDVSSKHATMAIKVTKVQKDGSISADVEWVATQQVDHYEISYFCDPLETVVQQKIVENRCRLTTLKWDSEYTVRVTAYLPDGKTSFDSAIFKTDPKVKDPNPVVTDVSSKHATMAIKVTKVQKDGSISADVEWVATQQVDHYEISYFCDPLETVVQQKIVENRCRLTTLKWDSEYTVRVTAYLPDGKTSFDSAIFKTDPKVKDPNPVVTDVSSKHATMAIKVTKVQKDGSISADVEWVATQQVDHYEISYFCDPLETVVQQKIVENRCRLTTLKWDSEYTVRVTAYLPDGKTNFDSAIFKTDPKVKDTKPAIMDISPRHVKMTLNVTNVQKSGMMSADVKWTAKYQPGKYEVSYYCNQDETVVLKNITENRCMLTNLRWDSTYTIKVMTQLQDGVSVFDEKSFKTDPEVKCFPMAASEICSDKLEVPNSFDTFTASNRIKEGVPFNAIGKFSGIVYTPVLTQDMHFWTMNIDLSVFEERRYNNIFLDFGIIHYSNLEHCFSLTNNRGAYSCSVLQKKRRKFHLEFQHRSNDEGRSYALPLEMYQKAHFCYGFLYDKINGQFTVMDCQSQEVLHVFHNVIFRNNYSPVFAICPYHNEAKMRVEIELDNMHAMNEDVSSWMQKINNFG